MTEYLIKKPPVPMKIRSCNTLLCTLPKLLVPT